MGVSIGYGMGWGHGLSVSEFGRWVFFSVQRLAAHTVSVILRLALYCSFRLSCFPLLGLFVCLDTDPAYIAWVSCSRVPVVD